MQSVSSRIWTRIVVSISYDNNHYTTGTSLDRTLSGATAAGQSGPWSDGNEGVLYIPQSSRNTGASPSDCLMSYQEHSLVGSYSSAEMQSVFALFCCFLMEYQNSWVI